MKMKSRTPFKISQRGKFLLFKVTVSLLTKRKAVLNLLPNASPGIAHVSTSTVVTENKHIEMQTDCPSELGSPVLSQINNQQPASREKECDIYKSFSQLANSVAELQNVLLSEREISRKLQNEQHRFEIETWPKEYRQRNTDSPNNRQENLDAS